MRLIVLLGFFIAAVIARGRHYNTKSKIVSGAINVHLIPHSHDDVGWLKTVDQYSQGLNNSIQHANTGLTIDTVLSNLLDNPDRTFSYVEQAFFQRWVESASDEQLDAMQRVVASGQMTFINGAWAMHDEAAPNYVDMIDNTALGHRLIREQFGQGAIPTVTWQIDPFGHSAFQGSGMSSPLGGFDALFFGRIDYQDRDARQNASTLETIWRASPSTGSNTQTFAGAMPGYGPPDGRLCWDEVACSNTDPIQDDPLLEQYNVDAIVNLTVTIAEQWRAWHRAGSDGTLHLIWTMGSDFQYTNARGWYKNLDKLVHYVNLGTASHGVNMLYSDPGSYAQAKLAQDAPWPLKTDDYMPYADGPHAMWSGYFTSRPALKGYVRDTSAAHQAARQAQFFGARPADMGPTNPLFRMERAIGVTQHHDGVSGTSKQHVAYDYARRLAWGREDAQKGTAAALGALMGFTAGAFFTCDLSNATICPPLEAPVAGTPVLVSVWNSQGQDAPALPLRVPVALPAGVKSFAVVSAGGAPVVAQLVPASAADEALRTGYYGAPAPAPMAWLCWQGAAPAAGYTSFVLTPSATAAGAPLTHVSVPVTMATGGGVGSLRLRDAQLTNGVVTLTISSATGLVSSFTGAGGVSAPLAQSFGWWNSSIGQDAPNDNTTDHFQPSGAYIFRTNTSTLFPVSGAAASVTIINGPVVNEAQQVVADGWITQVTRLWAGQPWADFEYTVGPIPNGPVPTGKEVIIRYGAGWATAGAWATDSNCRDMIPRKRDYRSSWNYTVFEPIAGNYVPVNCRITTTDPASQATLSVSVDRSQGGASMVDGSVELMVHRRLQMDDRRGVGEPINEPGLDASGKGLIIRGVHRVSLDAAAAAPANGKAAVQALTFRAQAAFSPLPPGTNPATWLRTIRASYSGLGEPLPANVHLLTVHSQGPHELLLRLAHLFETGEDANLSKPATVGLTNLFANTTLNGCVEHTTPGARPVASVAQHTVSIEGEGAVTWPSLPAAPNGNSQAITISAMEIRTWRCYAS